MRARPRTADPAASAPAGSARSASGAPVWERYRDNVARHLIGISRDLQSRVMTTLAEQHGHRELRPSFGPLLSLIWKEGRPLGAIARELAISNQACSQLANRAEAAGYLARIAHPRDGRSKLVVLTPQGHALVEDGVRAILACERDYAAITGARTCRAFTGALAALYRGLGIPTHADPTLTAAAGRSIGLLPLIAVRLERDLMQAMLERGHRGLKMSHGQVLPLVGPDGGRVHEIARVQRVSRQAISAIARDLEALGHLCREPDPRDRRGVVLRLTPRGTRLIADSVAATQALERRLCEVLGAARFARLQDAARALYRAMHLEAEIFEASASAARPHAGAAPPRRAAHPRSRREIARLAGRLRHELGAHDAARLGALLAPRGHEEERSR